VTCYQTLTTTSHDGTVRASLLTCEIHTGKLHQIRAHMNALGSPVIGDFDYGGKRPLNLIARRLGRGQLALHAGYLALTHPCSGANLQLYTPVSTWFQRLADELNLPLPDELIDHDHTPIT
jgi:23S rRNA-/tRNA-specific pseudouridylate synthase